MEAQLHTAKEQLDDLEEKVQGWKDDFESLQLGPCTTTSDRDGCVNTMYRRLGEVLHCVVPDSELLSQTSRLYPYTAIQEKETLKTACERLLKEHSLEDKVVMFTGSPSAVYRVEYGEDEGRGEMYRGAKMFFLRAHVKDNVGFDVDVEGDASGLEYLTMDELSQCTSEHYFNKVKQFAD